MAAVRFLLDSVGAKSDLVILFRVMHDDATKSPTSSTVPEAQTRFFATTKLHMRLDYLPQTREPEMETFKAIMMEKFQFLEVTCHVLQGLF
jgi:hypothetical protein